MGLTDKGYQRRTFVDILNAKIARAKELFGEDIDTSDQSVLGKYLRINAYDQALVEEDVEAVYYSSKPNTAFGQSLDRLMPLVGIRRNPATAAVYSVEVQGAPGHTVLLGTLFSTDTDITYWTTQENTIREDGTCLVEASCTEPGTVGNLSSASAICKLVNPDTNITAVNGTECLSPGVDEESDTELRARFAAAVAGTGSGNETAIRASILRVPTVQYVAVISNNTNETDGDGRPPHSFECYVLGGDGREQEIAEAIFSKRPVGIQTVGDKAVTIRDVSGTERVVNYSPAQKVSVSVRVKIKTTTAFPDDGAALIQTAVSEHINGLGIGNQLVLSSIYGYIYAVTGVKEVTTLELSTNGGSTYSTSNVSVPEYGVVICAGVQVEVTE